LSETLLPVAIAIVIVIAIPAFDAQVLSGQTDVPAAAAVALAAWLALRPSANVWDRVALTVATALALMTKQTVILALLPLWLLLLLEARRDLRASLRGSLGAFTLGLAVGLSYDWIMAVREGVTLTAFLRNGTSGYWAELAAHARRGVLLRADVLGPGLRLPLAFALVYSALRVAALRHRWSALAALVVGLVWTITGPFAANVPNGPFSGANETFTFVGFALILGALSALPDDDAPSRRTLTVGLVLALPSLIGYVRYADYAERLAASAWPGLVILLSAVLAAAVRAAARGGPAFAFAVLPVVALAAWMGLASFDGLHGPMWRDYRSLGASGVFDDDRTTHLVLPALQETLATVKPLLGDGKVVVGDPMFDWFLPGRVDERTPGKCSDLRGARVFVLLTGDESLLAAREAGRLATPEQWAECGRPSLHQLTDGGNGYAVFAVSA
jgi:4-amino-4-deoxy-L-arabinose transferase-like glycosyltransferase